MAINTDVVANWHLDETSGTRYDTTDNNFDLTDGNTVTYDTGKLGNAAKFTSANSENLTVASDSRLTPNNGDWQMVFWIKFLAADTLRTVVCKYVDATNRDWYSWRNTASTLKFYVYNSGGASFVSATSNAYTWEDTWHFVSFRYVASTKKAGISVDDDGWIESSAITSSTNAGTASFKIGSRESAYFVDALIDEMTIRDGSLWTDAELTAIYNGGAGQAYPYTLGSNRRPLIFMS